MRNWFILFTTSFTMTTLILTVATWIINDMAMFDDTYVVLLAITCPILAFYMHLPIRLQRENMFVTALVDIIFIILIVFSTAVLIGIHPVSLINIVITSIIVVILYAIITLIYYFILTKEVEDMNKKINEWRMKHADSESIK